MKTILYLAGVNGRPLAALPSMSCSCERVTGLEGEIRVSLQARPF